MKTIRFNQTVPRRRHGAEQIFEAGQKYSLADDVANHYLKRGQAVIASAAQAAAPKKQDKAPAATSTEKADGDPVDSSADVGGEDGGDSGQRAEPAAVSAAPRTVAKKAAKKAAKSR